MSSARETIYEMIDGERDYQDTTFGTIPNRGETILLLQEYVTRATHNWATTGSNAAIQEYLREIAAIAIRGLEIDGCYARGVLAYAGDSANSPSSETPSV